ncbi:MAG TPA: OmpH family outer membrane protein [Pyrinomonadaceae bacterium]|nr:OmpH family outer membrane protein [Pyrinomonadaceae bacterium]
MKFARLASTALLLLTTCLCTAAQRRTPAPKPSPAPSQATAAATPSSTEVRIALIDTAVFGDDKEGIIRFREAVNSLEAEFKPRQVEIENLKTRLDSLTKEVDTLSKASVVSPESLKAKREEADRVDREIKQKADTAQKALEKRYTEVTGPVSRDIGSALNAFAERRGITLTLDISKLLPAILTIAPGADLTKEFVAEYNSKNPASTAPAKP